MRIGYRGHRIAGDTVDGRQSEGWDLSEAESPSDQASAAGLHRPLHNFASPIERAEISSRVGIRRITDAEQELLLSAYEGRGVLSMRDRDIIKTWTHCVSTNAIWGPIDSASFKLLDDVLTALRLAKPEHVTFPVGLNWTTISQGGYGLGLADVLPLVDQSVYVLLDNDLPQIRSLFRWVRSVVNRAVALAIDRFNISCDSRTDVDRLLDSWLALEALFVPDGSRGETASKASRRIAWYLATSRVERMARALIIAQAYEKRSEVAHGKPVAGLHDGARRSQEVLRDSLRKWSEADRYKSPEEVATRLDDQFLL